jgi:hypothetical protein
MFFRREMLAFRRRKVIFRKALRAELDIKKSGGAEPNNSEILKKGGLIIKRPPFFL